VPVCPICNTRIPFKLAVKSVDVLVFPEQDAQPCPACHARLVPTGQSVLVCVLLFMALAGAGLVLIRSARFSGFGPGLAAGLALGLLLSLSLMAALATLVRFRVPVGR